jgi:hypothetical protein
MAKRRGYRCGTDDTGAGLLEGTPRLAQRRAGRHQVVHDNDHRTGEPSGATGSHPERMAKVVSSPCGGQSR